MERAGLAAIASTLMLASCSGESGNAVANVQPVNEVGAATPPPAPAPGSILAGGGLAGLPLFPPANLESSATTARLFEAAYANSPSPSGAFERDGVHYDARPYISFRSGNMLVLLVSHASPENEQFHADSGSTSVFYFNADGTGPVRSYPQAILGTSWGGEAATSLIVLNGAPAAISEGGGSGQGYACTSRTIHLFSAGGFRSMASFPDGYDDEGAGGGTSISLVGAAPSADGSSLDLLYQGQEAGTDGERRPVSIRKSLRLDGRGAEWIQSWPYRC